MQIPMLQFRDFHAIPYVQPSMGFFGSLNTKPTSFALRTICILFSVSFLLAFSTAVQGQRTCGTDSLHAHMMGLPGFEKLHQDKVDTVNEIIASGNRDECDVPLIIPAAVHFQNSGVPIECAVEMAQSQIQTLNEDFGAYNPDIDTWYDLQPSIWPGISYQESCISFCLATLNHPAGCGLSDGDYAVTVDEAVVVNESNLAIGFSEKNNVNCTWFDNGRSRAQANGAVEPVVYQLNGTDENTSGVFSLLPVGEHIVTVEDASGCTAEATFSIDLDFPSSVRIVLVKCLSPMPSRRTVIG